MILEFDLLMVFFDNAGTPMNVPVRFRDLFYLECRWCHKEVEIRDCTSQQKKALSAGRICPHCNVAQSVEAIPQGKAGAWCAFYRWLEKLGWEAREQTTAWIDEASKRGTPLSEI